MAEMGETESIGNSGRDPTQGGEAAYFPLRFIVDFLRFLRDNRARVNVITYDDLAWGDDYDLERNYAQERQRWLERRARGEIDPDKVHVLLQHDVDTRPERTMALLRHEEALGIPSNVMIFWRRISRRTLRDRGELEYTPYELDAEFLRDLQTKRFVVGYHSNAFEQALFDIDRAQDIFVKDLQALSQKFDIDYFSAHGGAPSPDGRNNRDVPLPPAFRNAVRWVHNGHSPWFTATYSDGGINSLKRDPAKRDLRDFVRTWRRGERYRVLLHPQYYHDPCSISPRLAGTPWYEEVRAFYASGRRGSLWDNIDIREWSARGFSGRVARISGALKRCLGVP